MTYADRDTLFLFLDESGNLDFSKNGSRYWSLTAFCTFHPSQGKEAFLNYLYTLADSGQGQEHFHASEDKQSVRDEVFRLLGALGDGHEIHYVVAEKCKATPSLYRANVLRRGKLCSVKDETRFYRTVCRALLTYVFGCPRFKHAQKTVVVLSCLFNREKQQAIRKALSQELTSRAKVPFEIYFHENKSDLNCQLADYCGWAITRKWELGDRRSYDLVRTKIRNEFDIFARGTAKHY